MEKLTMWDLNVIVQTLREGLRIHGLHSYSDKTRERIANKVAECMNQVKVDVTEVDNADKNEI
jgi:hypothetical protein